MSEPNEDPSAQGESIIETVPEPRRAKLTEDFVQQLLADEGDPELADIAQALVTARGR